MNRCRAILAQYTAQYVSIMLRHFFLLIGVVTAFGAKSQTFVKSITGPATIRPQDIINTADGGHAIVGFTAGYAVGLVDAMIIRTDGNGDTLWTRTFGSDQDEFGHSIVQYPDGGFLINGTGRFGTNVSKAFLLKMSANGSHLWTKRYGGSTVNTPTALTSMALTPDGGTMLAGIHGSFGSMDLLVIRTNSSGDTLWGRRFDWSGDMEGRSIAVAPSGGSVVTGTVIDGGSHVLLHRLDDLGNVIWSRTFDGLGVGHEVRPTADGGFVVVGSYSAFAFLLKTDGLGNVEWLRLYGAGTGMSSTGTDVRQTSDGGYILTGMWNQTPWLVRADSEGDFVWMNTYTSNAMGGCVAYNSDGGYTMAAYSLLSSPAPMWLVRTDANGNVPCLRGFEVEAGHNEIPIVEVELPFTVLPVGTVSTATPVVGGGVPIATACTTVGIDERTAPVRAFVHPDPATDVINVALPDMKGAVAYVVRDLHGRDLLRGALVRNGDMIAVESLIPGTYSLCLEGGVVCRFVKL